MKIYTYLLASLFFVATAYAQDVPFDKELFLDNEAEFNAAKKKLDKGYAIFNESPSTYINFYDPAYIIREENYVKALPFLVKANGFNPDNAELNYRLGRCYLMNNVNKQKSLTYFLKSYELDRNITDDIQYYLGISYHLSMDFEKAITAFEKYKGILSTLDEKEDVEKRIKECKTAINLIENPLRVYITSIGDSINQASPEYGSIISTNDSVMMFTSRRSTSKGAKKMMRVRGDYDEDVFISFKKNGTWSSSKNMKHRINTKDNDATVALSADGKRMIIYRGDNNGDLFECKLSGEKWSKPKRMNNNINTVYHESSASYSSDGSRLYFTSNKPGGYGGQDIYVTHWNEGINDWEEAENIGREINSKQDEEAPFIHSNGKTLYFSSRGHKTMGDYDVFKSVIQKNGRWGEPENMGYPINTVEDDVFFVINGSGRRGYYSSSKNDEDKDIYQITFLGKEKPFELSAEDNLLASGLHLPKEKIIEKKVNSSTKKITVLKGVITSCETLQPLSSTIEMVTVNSGRKIATSQSDKKTGKYSISFPVGKNYRLVVKNEKYLSHSEKMNFSESSAFKEDVKDVCLNNLEVGKRIILKNVTYVYQKTILTEASKKELNYIIQLLKDNPTIKIEISAYTDSRGRDEYNQKLSERRAEASANYIIGKGIAKKRVSPKGYGSTQPIHTDAAIEKLATEEEKEDAHRANRRAEFKIIK